MAEELNRYNRLKIVISDQTAAGFLHDFGGAHFTSNDHHHPS